MKKVLSLFMSIVMLFSITAGLDLTSDAEVFEGICGADVNYSLNIETGVLTISGTGEIDNYFSYGNGESPWYCNRSLIKAVNIMPGITKIGYFNFSGCDNLTSVTIPNSVTSIGDGAFECCKSLRQINIPDSVEKIGELAFRYSSNLSEISMSSSIIDISSRSFIGTAFYNDSSNWIDNVLYISDVLLCAKDIYGKYVVKSGTRVIADSAFDSCNNLTEIEIPNGVTNIGDYAFSGCDSLTSITIPNSVTKIGENVFEYCTSLAFINVDDNNQVYLSQDGIMFSKDKTDLIQYPIGNLRTTYTIPNSVKNIGDYAFSDCDSLTSITIPNSVTSIDRYAFYGCSSLTSVTIPESITSISSSVFESCISLTSITIPSGVISIGDYAFYNCTSLTSIVIPDSVISICDYAFSECDSLTTVIIPSSVKKIEEGAFNYCRSLADVYYFGTKEQWNNTSIEDGNDCLTNATFHYNYHEHKYSYVVTPASCTEGGYTTHTCTVCGDSYADSYTNPTGHIFNGGKNCVVCGAVNPNYVEPTPTPTPAPTTTATAQTTTTTATTTVKKPKSTSISKLTKGKKQFKVTWKKVSSIDGYQIQYSTDKKFKKNNKNVTAKKGSTSATIKKLKSGKTYYVRVRTYKTTKVNGKSTKVYSSWSKVKSVKTK